MSKKDKETLCFFEFITDENYTRRLIASGQLRSSGVRENLNPIFCHGGKIGNGFNPTSFLDHIQKQLEEFIKIFNLYLELVIDKLEPKSRFKIEDGNWVQPEHIFSFNYKNTFQKFYKSTSAEFLHGRFGEKQNIVLGVSDLEDESLRKYKAYGFTKYHQKLFKETDYLFLDDCSQIKKKILGSKPSAMGKGSKFLIWGHSLDQSDQEYIQEIFKLNDQRYIGVTVIVYYYDDSAKFSLLNNLLAILGKDKIEHWMKNKWLTFEPNPTIDFGIKEISTIQ